MIVSENTAPELIEFQKLMKKTDEFLNKDAKEHESYYKKRTAQLLEEDVCYALNECAKGTKFEKTIQLISGAQFPDIQIKNFYGVEVKSTIKDHWTSTGSSILESTRDTNIHRIYMTFGKLGAKVEFRSRPYEDCLSEIAVTHYPRYKIDMELKKGETIFDKIGLSYDELRKLKNPVEPVSKYYKSKLKPGESLWWASDSAIEDQTVPMTVRLFSTLLSDEQEKLRVVLYTMFPQILGKRNDKYNKPALFLMTRYGVVNPSFRDMFSAGGQEELPLNTGVLVRMPAAFGRISRYKELIEETLNNTSNKALSENWGIKVNNKSKLFQWMELCATEYASTNDNLGYDTAIEVLEKIFSVYNVRKKKELRVAGQKEILTL